MGDFRIQIDAVGGHGCGRQFGDGQQVHGCGTIGCPDCELVEFLKRLSSKGVTIRGATLTHWPGEACEVVDSLTVSSGPYSQSVRRIRKGAF